MMSYLLFLCFALSTVYSALDYTTTHKGKLTFYGAGADSGGTCMYNNPKHSLGIPTIAIGNFGNAEKCGTCVQITPLGTGTGNSNFPTRAPFVAYVNNQCPECGEDNLDLAESSDGIWDISWKFVDCPVSGNIALQLKTGSSIYHTEISARNFKNAIKSIEYNINGGWVALARQPYNYFVLNSQIALPVQVRLTSFLGNQQTLTLSSYSAIEPTMIATSVQFPAGSSAPVTPPTPPPTPVAAPVKPPTPVAAPVKPPTPVAAPTKASCSYGSGTNDWWVEVVTGKTTDTIYLVCSDGTAQNNCPYDTSMSKYTCKIAGKPCTAPRRAYVNGACCSIDTNSCGSAVVSDSSTVDSNTGSLSYGVVIGIVLAAVVVTGLLVGVITFQVAKKSVTEERA